MAKRSATLIISLILLGLPGLGLAQDKPEAPVMQMKPEETQEQAAELNVVRDAVSEGIIDREPVDAGEAFSPNLGRIYYFTEVESSGPSAEITHVWYYGDREMARVTLPVEGARWRTWSSKGILPEWVGQWKVEAVSMEGTVLASESFSVETPPASEAAPASQPTPAAEATPAAEPEKK